MELLELAHSILKGFGGLGTEVAKHYLELAAGVVALLVVSMKAYSFGQEQLSKRVKKFMLGEDGFWDSPPKISIKQHTQQLADSIPVIMIANYKGGVAKSTTTANLGAFFDSKGLRVLFIDFDYQGSLTDAIIRKEDGELHIGSSDLIEGFLEPKDLLFRAETPSGQFKRSRAFASFYSFSRTENRVVFNWLVGKEKTDIRYRLHSFLSSREVQNSFDIVLIDCPPRLMTATANAICASTHVLVPTILDDLSTSAALNTINSILKLRRILSPSLKIIGVTPTFVQVRSKFNQREASSLDYLRVELAELDHLNGGPIPVLEQERRLRKEAIASSAGQSVAFFENHEIEAMYSQLGYKISALLGGKVKEKVSHGNAESTQLTVEAEQRVIPLRG